jgi:hypothetical protein
MNQAAPPRMRKTRIALAGVLALVNLGMNLPSIRRAGEPWEWSLAGWVLLFMAPLIIVIAGTRRSIILEDVGWSLGVFLFVARITM